MKEIMLAALFSILFTAPFTFADADEEPQHRYKWMSHGTFFVVHDQLTNDYLFCRDDSHEVFMCLAFPHDYQEGYLCGKSDSGLKCVGRDGV